MTAEQGDTIELKREVLSRLGVFVKDYATGEGFANELWQDLGYSVEDMMGDRWLDRVHPDDREQASDAMKRHLEGEAPEFRSEYRVRGADGTYRWLISVGVAQTRDGTGHPISYVGHDSDVSLLHGMREELQAARQEAEDRATEAEVLRGAGAVVVATLDAPTAVRSVIQQLRTLVHFDTALVCELDNRDLRLVGGSSDITERTWRAYAKRLLKPILAVIKSRIPDLVEHERAELPFHLVVPLVVRGATVGILVVSRTDRLFEGEEVRITMSMADYLALALSNARLYARMQQRAEVDQLSGVLTRRAFLESAEQIMDSAFHTRKPLCCFILDLDHFKSINDTFGHPVGDQVIRMLGAVMRDSLRSTDLVGRFGGEEFCAILTETPLERGMEVAERLRIQIARTAFGGVNREVTASIGLASLNQDGSHERLTIEQAIKYADVALYNAKANGRNRVIAYEPGMQEE